jgi:ElaB/YqjD/DUF883 family membrane-anchored ribosome-binding protein
MARETLEVTEPLQESPLTPPVLPEPTAPPVEESADEIEARLRRTQEAMAGKLDVLEEQTLGSIRTTIGAVSDTVSTVQAVVADPMAAMKAAVSNPIGQITDGVKSTVADVARGFDPSDLIRKHPLEAVGVAVAGGVVLSMLLNSRTSAGKGGGGTSGLLGTLTSSFQGELMALGKQLFSTVSQTVLERVKTAVTVPPPDGQSPTGQI